MKKSDFLLNSFYNFQQSPSISNDENYLILKVIFLKPFKILNLPFLVKSHSISTFLQINCPQHLQLKHPQNNFFND